MKFSTHCIICSKEIELNELNNPIPAICDECRKAISWAKEQMFRNESYDICPCKDCKQLPACKEVGRAYTFNSDCGDFILNEEEKSTSEELGILGE